MKNIKQRWSRRGFTIIESIVTLLLVSIMAVMLVTFTQPSSRLSAFNWFSDDLLLQQSMEKILGDYKSQRNDPYNPFNPGVFRQYVINKYPLVNASQTGFLTFTCSGTAPNITCTAGWPPQATIPSGNTPPVLIITVQKDNIILSMIVS